MTDYISISITAEFQAYPRHSCPIYGEPATEGNGGTNHERNTTREADGQRNAELVRMLDFLQNILRDDRNDNRSRRNSSFTAPYAPRYEPHDHPPDATPRSTQGVDATPRSPTSAVDSGQSRVDQSPDSEPVIPELPTATPEPEWNGVPVLIDVLQEPIPGEPTIIFDISRGPNCVGWKLTTYSFPWGPGEFDLPASTPTLSEMTITVVVDDPLPKFEWPIVVSNPSGITCGDVIHAVWRGFHEHVPKREYRRWDDQRREDVKRAFFKRSADPERQESAVPGVRECLRRIDYMSTQTGAQTGWGDGIMFRGMTAGFDVTGGWLMFVGPQGPGERLDRWR